ncbi:hypothetical protein HYZ64_03025 [Candidatus Berkelbacteria bacterium]|nr:hypothetical protein [Candidatus Berkelbacteria bacterium]
MAHTSQETQSIVESLNRLDKLFKIREARSITEPIQADFLAILLAVIRLMLDLSIYLFMTGILVMGVIFLFSMGNEEMLTRAKRTLNQSLIGLAMTFSSFAVLEFFIRRLSGPLAFSQGANIAIVFGTAYNLVLIAAGSGLVIILLYAGTRYLFAGGNEENQEGAKKMINAALYGIILTLGSFAISRLLMTRFGAIP